MVKKSMDMMKDIEKLPRAMMVKATVAHTFLADLEHELKALEDTVRGEQLYPDL